MSKLGAQALREKRPTGNQGHGRASRRAPDASHLETDPPLNLHLLRASHQTAKRGYLAEENPGQPMALFHYTLDGSGYLAQKGGILTLTEGTLLLLTLPDGHRRYLGDNRRWEFLEVAIAGSLAPVLVKPIVRRFGRAMKLAPASEPVAAMWTLQRQLARGQLRNDQQHGVACYQFLSVLARYVQRNRARGSRVTFQQAWQIAENRIREPDFGVEQWAAELGFSRTYFAEWVQRQTGTSAVQLLRNLRLARAIGLLQSTNLSLSKIAARVGLSASQTLSHMIRAQYGLTPGQLRTAAQADVVDNVIPLGWPAIQADFLSRPIPIDGRSASR